ncbi:PREDICTED: glyoxylate/hydroxypyruvate reductase HPR3-like [Camelina sativa]|uniref:Glyoxylate/hydroxypyruvate reductase HPR3-like n=1 Tax=Camelina sativa TaxID=90675 RepID=A0ABM0YZ17_CAMSA|nr:PREDICTED: glyoxylate/hydroxypyruvate reductase HPR3-like [Camelina sativa]
MTTTSITQVLPRVLFVKRHAAMGVLGDSFVASTKFEVLKAFESPLPLPEFLADQSHPVSAIIAPVAVPVTADLIRLLPNLRLVVTTSTGVDHVDLVECRRRGISVANAGSSYSEDVADTAVGLLIDVFRRISAANRFVKQRLWPLKGDYPLGSKLGRKRIGIVGLGSIGSMVATRLEAFGCQISYSSRNRKPSFPYHYYVDVHEMAANSDALVICCELNDKTLHLINRDVFAALGKQGVIVNVARGGIIDEGEMVRCLREGEIGGAGLDVFEDEPNVPKELFELDNVVLSPHCAYTSLEGLEQLGKVLVGNIEAFFSNKPLLTPVL